MPSDWNCECGHSFPEYSGRRAKSFPVGPCMQSAAIEMNSCAVAAIVQDCVANKSPHLNERAVGARKAWSATRLKNVSPTIQVPGSRRRFPYPRLEDKTVLV